MSNVSELESKLLELLSIVQEERRLRVEHARAEEKARAAERRAQQLPLSPSYATVLQENKRLRALCAALLRTEGHKHKEIGEVLGVSASRSQQLVKTAQWYCLRQDHFFGSDSSGESAQADIPKMGISEESSD